MCHIIGAYIGIQKLDLFWGHSRQAQNIVIFLIGLSFVGHKNLVRIRPPKSSYHEHQRTKGNNNFFVVEDIIELYVCVSGPSLVMPVGTDFAREYF